MTRKPLRSAERVTRVTPVIVHKAIESLIVDPSITSRHNRRQILALARSIRAAGFLVPVAIDAAGRVIAGQRRVLAAQLMGLTHVPTLQVDHLSAAQARGLKEVDDRLTDVQVGENLLRAASSA